jgi:hypothetical protein
MGIDASIYGNLKPVQMPDMMSAATGAANLSSLAMQQQRMAKQGQREDEEAARLDKLRKAAAFGSELDSFVGMRPETQAVEYPKLRERLLKDGVISPDTLTEQYDPGLIRNLHGRWQNTAEGIDIQLKKAGIKKAEADAAHSLALARRGGGKTVTRYNPETGQLEEVPVGEAGKQLPANQATEIGSLLGAADASAQIEQKANSLPTGKMAAAWDWVKEATGFQDEDRAKALADIGTQRNEVMSRIAGANVVADEKSRIQEGIPTRTDAPEAFMGKAKSTTDKLLRDSQSRIDSLKLAGYDVSGLEQKLAHKKAELERYRSMTKKEDGGSGLMNEAVAAPAPKVGEIKRGFQYLGGDPANQSSWKKVN